MVRTYYAKGPDGYRSADEQTAEFVLIQKEELECLEWDLKKKTEEVDRLYKKLTGDGLPFRVIKLDVMHEWLGTIIKDQYGKEVPPRYQLTVGLPVGYDIKKEKEAEEVVLRFFKDYVNNRNCRLHFLPKGGWSVQLNMTKEEYLAFEMPKSI